MNDVPPPQNSENPDDPPGNGPPTSKRVCGAELELQYAYLKALCVVPVDVPAAEPGEVFDMLRCVLEAGHPGEHHGIGRSLPMSHPGEVWASWPSERQPAALLRLPDCPRTDPADRDSACVLFDGHPGAHSWAQSDPDEERLRARTGLLEPGEVISVRTPPVGSCEHRRTEERYGVTRCHACGLRLRR